MLGALTGTVGSFAALMAIRAIVGIAPDAAGTLHLFDGAERSTGARSASPRIRPARPVARLLLRRLLALAGALRLPFDGPLGRLGVDQRHRLLQRHRLRVGALGSVAWVVPSLT